MLKICAAMASSRLASNVRLMTPTVLIVLYYATELEMTELYHAILTGLASMTELRLFNVSVT